MSLVLKGLGDSSARLVTDGLGVTSATVAVGIERDCSWKVHTLVALEHAAAWRVKTTRTNEVTNARAIVDVSGWDTAYGYSLSKVTGVPGVSLPAGTETAFKVPATPAGGTMYNTDGPGFPLPPGVSGGDWVHLQFEACTVGSDPDDYTFYVDLEFKDASEVTTGIANVVPDEAPPAGAFSRYAFVVQVPTDSTHFAIYFTNDEVTAGGADEVELYLTKIQLEGGEEGATVEDYADGDTAGWDWEDGRGLSRSLWTTDAAVRVSHESAWLVESALTPVEQVWDAAWQVRNLTALERESSWAVLAPEAVGIDAECAWRVSTTIVLARDSAWLVKDIDPLGTAWESSWTVRTLIAAVVDSSWKVARRSHIVPGDPPVEVIDDVSVYASFNGLDLNNGITTHNMAEGTDMGTDVPQYDMIRHYDGSRLAHDVQITETQIVYPLGLTFPDAATLGAFIAGLNSACKAGGTFAIQSSPTAPMRSYAVLPSSPPDVKEDNRFILQHAAFFDLVLTRWAE